MIRLINVVYQDDALLVLNKPAGLLCVPGRGPDKQDCLSTRVLSEFADALVVHRLDMATSGLVVMARGIANQRFLSRAFAARQVRKRYIALVDGNLAGSPAEWQTIDLPLMADWPNRPLQKVDHALGKPSSTRWRVADAAVLAMAANAWGPVTSYTLHSLHTCLEVEPLTGRTHQIRLHLASVGHPILGDGLYAGSLVAAATPRLMLHAQSLRFSHPVTDFYLNVNC